MSRVHLERDGAIARLRLDNPAKLNALTSGMIDELEAHCGEIERSSKLRAALLISAPCRAFCAGADVAEWGDLSAEAFARDWIRRGHRAFDRLARLCVPTIAVLDGDALGGGLELAAACDLRVMAPTAAIALPEAGIGVIPGWSGTQRLARLLPEPVLKEMALFGRRVSAERALALGFAAEVAEDPHAAAQRIAEAAQGLSPRSRELAKSMIHAGGGEDSAAMIEALGGAAAADGDRAEGVAAFREKRSPAFAGA